MDRFISFHLPVMSYERFGEVDGFDTAEEGPASLRLSRASASSA